MPHRTLTPTEDKIMKRTTTHNYNQQLTADVTCNNLIMTKAKQIIKMATNNTHISQMVPLDPVRHDNIWHRGRYIFDHFTLANGLRFPWLGCQRLTCMLALMCYILAAMKLTEAGSFIRLTQRNNHANISELLDNLLRGYDNSIRPDFGGPPATVEVDIMVRSMGPISEVDMTYSMDCYFRQSWVDKRLAFKGAQSTLALSVSMLKRIWKPDTYFYNGKQSYLHTITTPNKFVRIHQNGRVLYSSRLTIKAGCPMNLEDFPMDIQKCPLKFGSFGYTTADVIYRWNKERPAVAIAEDMKLSQFDLVDCPAGNLTDVVYEAAAPHYYHHHNAALDDKGSSNQQFHHHQTRDWQHQNRSGNQNKLVTTFSGPIPKNHHVRGTGIKLDKGGFGVDGVGGGSDGNAGGGGGRISFASDQSSEYSMLMVNFHLQRHMGNFLIQVYGPCCLLVVLSWVSFWLNREATADRVSLGITTVLTMTFLGLEARTDLPKVPYPTALDFFVFLSFAFIFATIVQFAVVHYFTKYGSGECYFIIEEIDSDTEAESAVRQTPKIGAIGVNVMTPSSSIDSKIYEVIPLTTCSINIKSNRDSVTRRTTSLRGERGYKAKSSLRAILKRVWNWCSLKDRQPKHGVRFEVSDDDDEGGEEQHLRANEDMTPSRSSGRRRMSYYRREELDARRKGKRTPQYNSVSKIDRASRFVFPMLFLLINVFYWYGYLSRSSRFMSHNTVTNRCFLLAI